MRNEQKLKDYGYLSADGKDVEGRVRYYHRKFQGENGPPGEFGTATVCLIREIKGDWYARGIAYCNPIEQFVKKKGRDIALGRAIKAIESEGSSERIPRTAPARVLTTYFGWQFMSDYIPASELTEFEEKLEAPRGTN